MAKARRLDPSVMASKAPAIVVADDARSALMRQLNYFPTPPWAARAGGELIARLDPPEPDAPWTAWEPACGEGHCVHGLLPYFAHVWATDIHDHGSSYQAGATLDFLSAEADDLFSADWIVSNPPFEAAADFVRMGLHRARRGVAMLCRLNWIESAGRFSLFFGDQPLTVFAPFAERVPMTLGRWDPSAGSATGYAWFVWAKGEARVNVQGRLTRPLSPHPIVLPIPPGTKARLTQRDDARLWGVKVDAPLFEGLDDA